MRALDFPRAPASGSRDPDGKKAVPRGPRRPGSLDSLYADSTSVENFEGLHPSTPNDCDGNLG